MTELSVRTGVGLSPDEAQAVLDAAAASLSTGTRRAYASAMRSWRVWCRDRGVTALPADPAQVALWLTELARQGRSVSTLDRSIAALRHAHLDAGLDDPGTNRGVVKVRQGLRRRVGTAPVHQAHPLTTEQIRRIVAGIDERSLRGKRDRALILLGYAAALRTSDLAGLKVRDVAFRAKGIALRIGRSKADQEGAGTYVGVVRGEHLLTDPVNAVYEWLQASGLKPSDPLFTPISWSDLRPTLRPMDPRSVGQVVAARAQAAGLSDLPISGHSLRAGHATTATENGVPATRLARTTRHKNLATLAAYVRPADVLGDTSSADLGL